MNSFFLSLFSSFFMLLHQQLLQETLRKDKKKEKKQKKPISFKMASSDHSGCKSSYIAGGLQGPVPDIS